MKPKIFPNESNDANTKRTVIAPCTGNGNRKSLKLFAQSRHQCTAIVNARVSWSRGMVESSFCIHAKIFDCNLTYKQACTGSDTDLWKRATESEMKSFWTAISWKPVSQKERMSVLSKRRVFCMKMPSELMLACLLAQSPTWNQRLSTATWSWLRRSICLSCKRCNTDNVLALVPAEFFELHQMDLKTVLLYRNSDEKF